MQRPNWIIFSILIVTSLFLGYAIFTAIAVNLFPGITSITKPILCANGEQTVDVTRTQVRPGETYFNVNVYCDGEIITFQSVMLTGLIASLVFFVILLVVARNWLFRAKNAPAPFANAGMASVTKGKTPLERMSELKEMRDKNLISQVEYERKKDEIMKEL
jgi:hypothetical protein